MAHVVFTGGARSGKSVAATRLAAARERDGHQVTVVVFGRVDESDPEFAERVRRHREERQASWVTREIEFASGLEAVLEAEGVIVIDCVGTLLGLVMEEEYDAHGAGTLESAPASALPSRYERAVGSRFDLLIDAIVRRPGDTIVVTNEVGEGLVPSWATGRLFRDLMGLANRRLVGSADAAYLCVTGRLIDLSRLPAQVHWPED